METGTWRKVIIAKPAVAPAFLPLLPAWISCLQGTIWFKAMGASQTHSGEGLGKEIEQCLPPSCHFCVEAVGLINPVSSAGLILTLAWEILMLLCSLTNKWQIAIFLFAKLNVLWFIQPPWLYKQSSVVCFSFTLLCQEFWMIPERMFGWCGLWGCAPPVWFFFVRLGDRSLKGEGIRKVDMGPWEVCVLELSFTIEQKVLNTPLTILKA